ncbi:MAG: pyruvate kinase [Cyclobacteriaceae bacterium]|nr:pyruvate kinase [Cyclobacteriaceae bacterium]
MEKIIFNKTKVIATVGPASNSKETLKELIIAGVDVFRLNFSHGSHDDHAKVIAIIRELNKEMGTFVSILQDLQGPKIRLNMVEEGCEVKEGDKLVISTNKVLGNSKKVSTTYQGLTADVKPGETILIDDGKIELKVESVKGSDVTTKVVHGGPLLSKKGINLPSSNVSAPSLTEKDLEDLNFGIENDVDWIALSFVRDALDIIDLKIRIEAAGKDIRVVAKIEKPEAVKKIDAIIDATDAVMVARGDLGVEIEMEDVPIIQKRIIKKCNAAAKPVIVATQMLESMIENARPTRAETNDVANSVIDGADTVMLSAETAAGKFPVLAVKSMTRIIKSVEANYSSIYFKYSEPNPESPDYYPSSLIQSSVRLSFETQAEVIAGMTWSGFTAWRLSANRPKANIFIFTGNKKLLTIMNLIWGVRGYYFESNDTTDGTMAEVEKILKKDGYLKKGDAYITMASMPIAKKYRTNMMKLKITE